MAKRDFSKRLLLATAVAGALTAPANADVSDTGVFGYWTTFAGVAADGRPVCGMRTDWNTGGRGPTTSSFMIKFFGQDEVGIHIAHGGWKVPYGQPVTVQIQIDQAPAIKVTAYGAGDLLQWKIKSTDVWAVTGKRMIDEFGNLLSSGRLITVSFPAGNEPPWVGQLAGASAAIQSFVASGNTINAANKGALGTAQAPETTQPFTPKETPKPSTSTQPFQPL